MESTWSCQRTTLICPVGSTSVPSCLISFVLLQVMIFLGWVRLNTLAFIVIGCSGTAFVRESRDVMESVGTVTGAKAFSSLSVVCELLVSWLMTMSFVGEFQFILNLDIFTGDFCSWKSSHLTSLFRWEADCPFLLIFCVNVAVKILFWPTGHHWSHIWNVPEKVFFFINLIQATYDSRKICTYQTYFQKVTFIVNNKCIHSILIVFFVF